MKVALGFDSWISVLPPLVAIGLAIAWRQVFVALFCGVWMGWTILNGWNPVGGLADGLAALVNVFSSAYNTQVILFSALVGSLITLTQRSGGVEGFVEAVRRRQVGRTRRSVGLLAWITGVVVFVESSITCLVVGAVARPLADRVRMSREKLAYLTDSTSAPVCILIPLNAWGAYVMGLLAAQGVQQPLSVMVASIPLNFYAWAALAATLAVVLTGRDFGPMRRAERRAQKEGKLLADGATPMVSEEVIAMAPAEGAPRRAANMLVPLAVMIAMMPLGLYVTGARAVAAKPGMELTTMNVLGQGSGATAVFWAVLAAIATAAVLSMAQRILTLREVVALVLKGAAGLIPMAVIMMLAFAINDVCNLLGTGDWVARQSEGLLVKGALPAVLFTVSAVIAFSTGTSWGTFGIMMPIAVPLTLSMDTSLALCTAAVLSGGVFGDHASPISDTSVISSMATASDHMDHVRTQLPYALVTAAVALVAFLVAGLIA